ncbi:MAG: YIP1 family protein [Pseudomonadota bacterium]
MRYFPMELEREFARSGVGVIVTELPTLRELSALIRLTFDAQREGAAAVLRDVPVREALWLMFALVLVLTVLAGEVGALLIAGPSTSVLASAAVQGASVLLSVYLLYYVGRAFGGTGTFDGALALMIWLQFIFIFVQVFFIFVAVAIPAAILLVLVLWIGLFLWLTVNFAAELHGFKRLGPVFLGTLAVVVFMSLVLVVILAAFDLSLLSEPEP